MCRAAGKNVDMLFLSRRHLIIISLLSGPRLLVTVRGHSFGFAECSIAASRDSQGGPVHLPKRLSLAALFHLNFLPKPQGDMTQDRRFHH